MLMFELTAKICGASKEGRGHKSLSNIKGFHRPTEGWTIEGHSSFSFKHPCYLMFGCRKLLYAFEGSHKIELVRHQPFQD